ncbi:uncharacterized protein LOC120327742 isoform X1 [Styela clava]
MADCNKKHNDEAFITLATNDVYTRGALVLAQSLRKYGTTRKLVVMITPHVSPNARTALEDVFDDVRLVDVLDSRDAAHLALLRRPELGITFTKIHCWTLTEYSKGVFMDADMMALQNIDDLFEREELSAAPDSGWPDLFNSGLFVFRPSLETFNGLLLLAQNEGSFDGGDQGLLNTYFKDWATKDISRHLPFLYNLHVCASYTYMPAFKKFGKDTKVVHFLGPVKPWHHVYNRVTGGVQQIAGPMHTGTQHLPQYLSEWWAIYNDSVQKYFSREQEMTDHVCHEPQEETVDQNFHGNGEENVQTHHEECHQQQEPQCGVSQHTPEHQPPPPPRPPSPPPNPYHWDPPATFYREQPSYMLAPRPPTPEPEPQHTHIHEQHRPPSPPVEKTPQRHPEPENTHFETPPHESHDVPLEHRLTPPLQISLFTPPEGTLDNPPEGAESQTQFELPPQNTRYTTFSEETHSTVSELSSPSSLDEKEDQPSQIPSIILSIISESSNFDNNTVATRLKTPPSVYYPSVMMAEDKSFEDIVLIPAAILQSDKEQEGAASASRSPDERQREMLAHMRQWESGNIDYLGRDSFENIQARLESFMHQKPV